MKTCRMTAILHGQLLNVELLDRSFRSIGILVCVSPGQITIDGVIATAEDNVFDVLAWRTGGIVYQPGEKRELRPLVDPTIPASEVALPLLPDVNVDDLVDDGENGCPNYAAHHRKRQTPLYLFSTMENDCKAQNRQNELYGQLNRIRDIDICTDSGAI